MIEEGKGGYLFNPQSIEDINDMIKRVQSLSLEMQKSMEDYNRQKISNFDLDFTNEMLSDIYKTL